MNIKHRHPGMSRNRGTTILESTQNAARCEPGQPALWVRGIDKMISRDVFQPQPFGDSIKHMRWNNCSFVQWAKGISSLIDFQTLNFWGIKYVTLRNMTSNWENRSKGHTYQITSKWQDLKVGINGLKFFLARSFETMKEIEASTGVNYSSAQGQPRSLVWTLKFSLILIQIYMCLQQPS